MVPPCVPALLCYTGPSQLRSAAPHLRLALAGAEVDWYCGRTRKSGHRILVTGLEEQPVVLKVEDETESLAWYQALQRAIKASAEAEGAPEVLDEGITRPTNVVKASPEEVVRQLQAHLQQPAGRGRRRGAGISTSFRKMADAVKRDKKDKKKNQSPFTRNSMFNKSGKEQLNRKIRKRPTVEMMVQSGILKNAAVFGCPLGSQQLDEVRTAVGKTIKIPPFVWKTVLKLESKPEYLETDGLYRVPGDAAKIQKIRLEIDQGKWGVFNDCDDCNVLAGSLKLFLRELPEPLLPYNLHSQLVEAAKGKGRHGPDIGRSMEGVLAQIKCSVTLDCLEVLVMHLGRVADAANRMDIDNLGLLFGQVLLWPDPNAPVDMKFLSAAANNCQVADALIRFRAEIFHQEVPDE